MGESCRARVRRFFYLVRRRRYDAICTEKRRTRDAFWRRNPMVGAQTLASPRSITLVSDRSCRGDARDSKAKACTDGLREVTPCWGLLAMSHMINRTQRAESHLSRTASPPRDGRFGRSPPRDEPNESPPRGGPSQKLRRRSSSRRRRRCATDRVNAFAVAGRADSSTNATRTGATRSSIGTARSPGSAASATS